MTDAEPSGLRRRTAGRIEAGSVSVRIRVGDDELGEAIEQGTGHLDADRTRSSSLTSSSARSTCWLTCQAIRSDASAAVSGSLLDRQAVGQLVELRPQALP